MKVLKALLLTIYLLAIKSFTILKLWTWFFSDIGDPNSYQSTGLVLMASFILTRKTDDDVNFLKQFIYHTITVIIILILGYLTKLIYS